MSNAVVFKFIAIDKFKPVAKSIGAGMDRITGKTKKLNKEMKKSEGLMSRMGKRAGDLGKSAAKAGAKTAGVIAGIGAVMAKPLSVSMKFEDAMADLSAITGATGDELKLYEKTALMFAKKWATDQSEVAQSIKLIASAKSELLKDPQALINITESVLLLANTGMDLGTAAGVMGKSLNQFGAGADQAANFVDVLANGAKIGASEVIDTSEAIEKAGSIANLAGISFADLNAAIQVSAKGGIVGPEAGTALKTIILRLTEAKQKVKEFNPEVVGLVGAFQNIAKADLSTAQMGKMFGAEAVAVGSFMAQNPQMLSEFSGIISEKGSAQKQADIRMGTTSTKLRRKRIEVGQAVMLPLDRITSGYSKMVGDYTKEIDFAKNRLRGLAESVGFRSGGADSSSSQGDSKATIDINIKAPAGVVGSVQSSSSGKMLDVGTNLVTQ